jgi:precorrin-6B methylase 2
VVAGVPAFLLEACAPGRHVVVISSGDTGIYAMAALIYEHVSTLGAAGEAVMVPGGRIVINAVRESSAAGFAAAAAERGYALAPPVRLQVDAHNPITILAATRP